MQAKEDFEKSIYEVSYLNGIAAKEKDKDYVYYKVIILLLSAKLEKYVKDSANEYIKYILDLELTKEKLPRKLLIEIIQNEIDKVQSIKLEKYISNQQYIERAKVLSLIWDAHYKLRKLDENEFAISISNNGTTAFNDVYKKIGFPDLISNMEDFSQETSIGGFVTQTAYSISDTINKVINLRNQIIHTDATPSITENEIGLYIVIIHEFVMKVDAILSSSIVELSVT